MPQVIDFGGGQTRTPLLSKQIRNAEIAKLLQGGQNRPQIQSIGEGVANLGTDIVNGLRLRGIREDAQAKEQEASQNRIDAFAPKEEPGIPSQGPVQPLGVMDKKFAGDFPPSFGNEDQRTELANQLNTDTIQNSGTRFQLPQSPPTTRNPTLQEVAQMLLKNPQNAPQGLQILASQLANQEAAQRAANATATTRKNSQADALERIDATQRGRSNTPTSQEKNFALAQENPDFQEFLSATGAGQNPAAVKEFEFFSGLPDDKSKLDFINLKRAGKTIDLGGEVIQTNPLDPAGAPSATREKTIPPQNTPEFRADVARQTEIGKAEGKASSAARIDFPKFEASANESINLIDELITHPGLSGVVGVPSVKGFLRAPGTDEANFRERLDQIQGKQFLEAFESIKGGGQITEVEGNKATQAIARMGTAQTESSFIEAAKEFQGIVRKGLGRARTKAGLSTPKRRSTDKEIVVDF